MSDPSGTTVITPAEPTLEELQAQAATAAQDRTRADSAERELALVRAGVDTRTPIGRMFVTAYAGELTEEAIVAAAREVGAMPPAQETPVLGPDGQPITAPPAGETAPTAEQLQQGRDRLGLAAGETTAPAGTLTPATNPNPAAAGLQRFQELLAEGQSREDAASTFFQGQIDAAVKGNPAARYDAAEWKRRAAEQGGTA